MISSKVIEVLTPLFEIIKNSKGKTIGELKKEFKIERNKMKKGASGLIVEKHPTQKPMSLLVRLILMARQVMRIRLFATHLAEVQPQELLQICSVANLSASKKTKNS